MKNNISRNTFYNLLPLAGHLIISSNKLLKEHGSFHNSFLVLMFSLGDAKPKTTF